MRIAVTICLMIILSTSLVGCETFKGAAKGFEKDWAKTKTWDDWVQENMW